MTYMIYEGFFVDVEKKINRIAKKCRKHGNDFTFKKVGEETREIKDEFGRKRLYNFICIEVEGTARIDDWEFIATLEVCNGGNIIRKYNAEIDIPERFWNTENVCEHCGMQRRRNNLYIIHNVVTDEWKQVGKSCLKLYTNGLNAEYVAAYMDGITELEESNGNIGCNAKPRYPLDEVLGYAVEIIDKIGYMSAANSRIPTKYFVSNMIHYNFRKGIEENNRMLKNHGLERYLFENCDFEKEGTAERVNKIIDYWKNLDDSSDFNRNIKACIREGYIDIRNLGFVVYMPEGYNKYVLNLERKRLEMEQRAAEIEGHFGKVGDRVKNAKVRYIKRLAVYETDYGVNQFCKIVLEDGKTFYWSGKGIDFYRWDGNKEVEIIPESVSFTIKEHGEYKGNKQTKVTRCKVTYKDKKEDAA